MNISRPTSRFLFTAALTLVILAPLTDGMGSSAMKPSDTFLPVIPAPTSWRPSTGTFLLSDLQRIVAVDAGQELLDVAEIASVRLSGALGGRLPAQVAGAGDPPLGALVLRMTAGLGAEQYAMDIRASGIEISASGPAGFQHGVTTLIQLVLNIPAAGQAPALATGVIRDQPRFAWRGMLLDCGRHFMSVNTVKALLDKLAWHKFNVLHWHLTEDQGWRLEIPGYPLLTEVGAWRTGPDGTVHGGFYTSGDVKEILAYAAERNITVVPEIEMPGHSQAALAAYPGLSCTGGPFEVQTQWGIHADVLCAGREETFAFLEDVLTHVMDLFPGRYIHIGGDEVPKDRWRECDHCQARIRSEGLAGENELQAWFIGRIGQFLAAHGRSLIGWDEILGGGLPGDPATYTIQAWRGLDQAAAGARAGHDVIVSPTSHAYFDYDPGVLDLQQVFSFRPVPADLAKNEADHILGGQMNLWTEYIPEARVDTMLFPRLAAMAEALWTGSQERDFAEFLDRLGGHQQVLEHLGVKPGVAARPVLLSGNFDRPSGGHRIEISVDRRVAQALGDRDLITRYRVFESPLPPSFRPGLLPEDQGLPEVRPEDESTPASGIISVHDSPEKSWLVQARLFAKGRPYGAAAVLEVSSHAAVAADIVYAHEPSQKYPGGGPQGLVNGLHGSRYFQDGLWTGFEENDLLATVDLGHTRDLRQVSVRFLQDVNAWILLPRQVRFYFSSDGESWQEAAPAEHQVSDREQQKLIHQFAVDIPRSQARYIRVHGISPRTCPDWHPGHGQPCWIFADEIVVR